MSDNKDFNRNTSSTSVVEALERNVTDSSIKIFRSKTSSVSLATLNLMNSIIGGGIIILPYSMTLTGLSVGLILLQISAVISYFSLMQLVKSVGKDHNHMTYAILAKVSLGNWAYIIISICQFLFPLICCISYGIAIFQNLSTMMYYYVPLMDFNRSRFVILSVPIFLIILPLSIFKHISFLDKFSSVSLGFVMFYALIIVIKTILFQNNIFNGSKMWELTRTNIPQSFSIFAFSFCSQQNILPIYHSLHEKSIKNMSKVVFYSISLSSIIYIIMSVCGYLTFGGVITDNFFNEYCSNDHLINFTRVIFSLTLMLTFPLQMYSCREVILSNIIHKYCKTKKHEKFYRIVISCLLVGFCYIIACNFKKLGPPIEIAGSLTASPLAFIFPPLIYIKMTMKKPYFAIGNNQIKRMLLCIFMVIFGISVLILGTSLSIKDIVNEYQQETSSQPIKIKYWCPQIKLTDFLSNIPTIQSSDF